MLTGKKAVVTGAAGGIGRAIMKKFAENNICCIYALVRTIDDSLLNYITDSEQKNNIEIIPVIVDLCDDRSIKDAVKTISGHTKNIDILINNAGMVSQSSSFHMTSVDKMRDVFQVNFFGPTLLTQYVSRIMMKNNKGSIVNISSVAAIDGRPGQYEYVCSKAAIIGAVKELSIELGRYNIRVNGIAPGVTDTKMAGRIEDNLKEDVIQNTIMKRIADPMEIADVVLFMASDLSGYITGQILRVDGGVI